MIYKIEISPFENRKIEFFTYIIDLDILTDISEIYDNAWSASYSKVESFLKEYNPTFISCKFYFIFFLQINWNNFSKKCFKECFENDNDV